MVLEIKQHIELNSDNPLEARLTERPLKAYLVAQFALYQGIDAAVEQYGLSLAALYAAMSFYEDNREAIQTAIEAARRIGEELGAGDSKDMIAEIKKRTKHD